MTAGQGYTVNGLPTTFFPVRYPLFLTGLFQLFGPSLIVVKLSNVALYLVVLLFVYRVAQLLFASEIAARLSWHPGALLQPRRL